MASRSRQTLLGTAAAALALALGAVTQSSASAGTAAGLVGAALCPFTATELSTIVGRKVQRVALGSGRVYGQCAFSAVDEGKPVSPQLYLTREPGNAADLHDSYAYYVASRAQLAGRPQVKSLPELGPGAFTLTVPDTHVTNAFFLGDDTIATLSIDLSSSPRPERLVVAQILALAAKRIT
jgi:hypothetical protein